MKTKEELDALKEEVNNVNEKLKELSPEELEQVTGGFLAPQFDIKTDWAPPIYEVRFNNDPPLIK